MHPIHHLPYPENLSDNGFIDSTACSVQYSNKDQGAEIKALAGRDAKTTQKAKTDINSALILLPVSPAGGIMIMLGLDFRECINLTMLLLNYQ